ncbi:MAG: GMP synthase [Pseudomonadota bacterium]
MTLKLGFLLCDHIMPALEAEFPDYPEMFAAAFARVTDQIEWHVFDVTNGELPLNPAHFDAYLISGSRCSVYDPEPWIASLEVFVRSIVEARKRAVGLCFGHQLIAQALGGKVKKAASGWGIGVLEYQTLSESALLPDAGSFVVPACHQDQVVSLPDNSERVARADYCENFVIHYSPDVIGIQGHPEFEPEFIGGLLRWREFPAAAAEVAKKSLTRANDNLVLRKRIFDFLNHSEPL